MSDISLSISTPMGIIATTHPRAIPLLESLMLDYCCNGGNTLAQACAERGLDPQRTLRSIEGAVGAAEHDEVLDPASMSMAELADHIESTHHTFTREALASLQSMLPRLVEAHGQAHPELVELRECVDAFADDLQDHMVREERVLFPWLRRLERRSELQGGPPWSVRRPIDCMIHDHDSAGDMLARMRTLTSGYRVPDDACGTYRACLSLLESLERDTHIHIHKENNILFPRGVEAERERGGAHFVASPK
jgi:regulator of cell morphogenesis and NO signaling